MQMSLWQLPGRKASERNYTSLLTRPESACARIKQGQQHDTADKDIASHDAKFIAVHETNV